MDRRKFILAGAASAVGIGTTASADWRCTQFNWIGVQRCEAGVSIPYFTSEQECKNWCWAACVQAVFKYHRRNVSQKRIVNRVYSDTGCYPANGPQIVSAINGRWQDENGSSFHAYGEPLLDLQYGIQNPNAAAQVAMELANGNPLINGAVGHATMITAMSYYRDTNGNGQPNKITVRHPWPYSKNKRFLTAREAQGTFFIARIRVS